MAYVANQLVLLNQSGSAVTPKIWHYYHATDAVSTIATSGYFNDAADKLSANDIVYVQAAVTATPPAAICLVASNTGSVVDLTNGLGITATNTA